MLYVLLKMFLSNNLSFVGVDIQRFMQDNEYKRETMLGLAM